MPNSVFAWDNLPKDLLRTVARDLQLDASAPVEALHKKYGTPPTEGFVLDAWEMLRERWLAHDQESLAAVVDELWQPSRDGYRRPPTLKAQLEWLRGRRNTLRLREAVLAQLVALGERATSIPPSWTPNELDGPFPDTIFEVEGFQVRLVLRKRFRAPTDGIVPYPYERAARGGWNVARWREQRFAPNYPDFDIEVVDGNGRGVHGRTLLSTVRDAYAERVPAASTTLAPVATRHPREMAVPNGRDPTTRPTASPSPMQTSK